MSSLRIVTLFTLLGCVLIPVQGAPLVAEPEVGDFLFCSACNQAVKHLFGYFKDQIPDDELIKKAVFVARTIGVFEEDFIRNIVTTNLPTMRYVYENTEVEAGNICGIIFPEKSCQLSHPEKLEWAITPSSVPKPDISEPSQPPAGSPTMKVLHLADLHWDPNYVAGGNANCKDPLCCRSSSGAVSKAEDAAGYWGDYRNCDVPWRTVENTVAHMSLQHSDADYIIWTGDLVPHDVESSNRTENVYIIGQLLALMKQYFPGVPVYATLGNHETRPVNVFAPPEITDEKFSVSWLYEEAARQWSQWLPDEASATIRYGGYYTTLIRPGLRLVSMNMNYCYAYSWWSWSKSQDPASGLLWLNGVLEKAEIDAEKVHIMSHIAPGGGDCMPVFSREYGKIINRFESTVSAQFFGHTHQDEFKVFYDTQDASRATNVAFLGPSVTTFPGLNPGYRVYSIDGPRSDSSFAVLDHSTWFMNLTAANLNADLLGLGSSPVWQELYSARALYGLTDLSPKQLDAFVHRMVSDRDLFMRYFRNYFKAADGLMARGCDDQCRIDLLCETVTTNFGDQSHCQSIKNKLKAHLEF